MLFYKVHYSCYYCILLANIVGVHIQCIDVEFNTPTLIKKNVPYPLLLTNSNPTEKFPVENFVFAFELLKTINPREELSVAAVMNIAFTGEESRGFSITKFTVNKDSIAILIEFRREAHNTTFRVRYSSAATDIEKENFYGKHTDFGIIFERYIDMLLPYIITITTSPEFTAEIVSTDRAELGQVLLAGRNGQIRCQATEGLPNLVPVFTNSDILSAAIVSSVNTDTRLLVWPVHLEDHGKTIMCRAARDISNTTLSVYHYMTDVFTRPVIEEYIPKGTMIRCIYKDGYPAPHTQWVFVSGPAESKKHYQLLDNNATLFINATAPTNSNWTFECTGSSYMPDVVTKYLLVQSPSYPIKRRYNFTITETYADNNALVQSSSTGIIVVMILLIFIIIAFAIFGVYKKEEIKKCIVDKKRPTDRRPNPSAKPIEPIYKYAGMENGDQLLNGSDKDDATCYLEIVGTVQPKSDKDLGPIHQV